MLFPSVQKLAIAASLATVSLLTGANARKFLEVEPLQRRDVEATLQAELAGNVSAERLTGFEDALRPLYSAVPKNPGGRLGHQVVKYMLHRFFVQQHGWYIKGLEPNGDTFSALPSAPAGAASNHWLPTYLQELLEAKVGGAGFALRDLAVLAATLEDLVRREAGVEMREVYDVLGFSAENPVRKQQAEDAINTYMLIYLMNRNVSISNPTEAARKRDKFSKKYAGWRETKAWMSKVEEHHGDLKNVVVPFETVVGTVAEIGEQFGSYNDGECQDLKTTLMGMEGRSRKAGRVRLVDFYNMSLFTHWRFTEKPEYLRTLGALDESDPKRPSLILPNYLSAYSNCLKATSLYAVCCRNECEDLMGHLEREIGAEAAQPGRILGLVAELASNTVDAPRNMSASLAERLQQVANSHGGVVPLHGRLFAQWMHHAYPRECPYPHQAGTTNPLTPEDWMKETGQTDTVASDSEMMQTVESDTCASDAPHAPGCNDNAELPWSEVEELLLVNSLPAAAAVVTRTGLSWKRELGLVGAGAAALALYLALQRAGHLRRLQGGKAQSVPMEFTQVKAALSLLAMAAWALDLLRGPALACAFCVGLAVVALAQGACAWACRRRVKPDEALTL